jgi:uncharacterized protein
MEIELQGSAITLLRQKAIFLRKRKILCIADLHFGKLSHFRKSGIPVPPRANEKNAEALIDLLNETKPERTIFLGDLFHSHYNNEWEVVGQVLKHFSACSFELVMGNHDIMSKLQYERHRMLVHPEHELVENLMLTHEPLDEIPDDVYNLAGHIHPGARLLGKGRQSIMLPCFYFGKRQGILPAFGSFTGLAGIPVKKNDRVYVVADEKIIRVADEG